MGPIKEILAETQFQEELTLSSQQKLVVVDFTASWCGPCQTIAPFYEQLSRKYPNAVFLKVDVDKCQETAVNQRVSVMPTFHFYRNKVKVDSMQGADPQKLEEKIQKYYDDGTADADVGVAGHVVAPKKSNQSKKREPKPKRESKASSKKKMKKSPGKYKRDKEHFKVRPQSEMIATQDERDSSERRRSSFRDFAKKVFSKDRKNRDDRRDDRYSRRSFKSFFDNLFHPHRKSSTIEGSSSVESGKESKKKKKDKSKK